MRCELYWQYQRWQTVCGTDNIRGDRLYVVLTISEVTDCICVCVVWVVLTISEVTVRLCVWVVLTISEVTDCMWYWQYQRWQTVFVCVWCELYWQYQRWQSGCVCELYWQYQRWQSGCMCMVTGADSGATRGVMVSWSPFLASHQCYSVGLCLAWGWNFGAEICGIVLSFSSGFSAGTPVTSPPPSVNGQPI